MTNLREELQRLKIAICTIAGMITLGVLGNVMSYYFTNNHYYIGIFFVFLAAILGLGMYFSLERLHRELLVIKYRKKKQFNDRKGNNKGA